MNITEFIKLLNDIKNLNQKDAPAVEEHLKNIKSKPISEDKLHDAMEFVKRLVMDRDPNRRFPPQFEGEVRGNFMMSTPSDMIQKENDFQKTQKNNAATPHKQHIGNNKNALFAANKPKSKNPDDGGWDLCTQVLLACFPVVGWAILLAYHCGCFTADDEVPAGPTVPNK